MTRLEMIAWLTSRGYTEDKFGHYQKVSSVNGKTYRYKVSQSAVRFEVKFYIVDHNEWLRIASNYLKNLSVNEAGQLVGLKR